MAYNLGEITKRVREYLEVRHPDLPFDPPSARLSVRVPKEYSHDDPWMFYIEYVNPTMTAADMTNEFDRYCVDCPDDGKGGGWRGQGADYITVRSGKPLLIGDGDDSGAIDARNGYCRIWLRFLED